MQDAAVTALGATVYAFGGLDSAQASSAEVVEVRGRHARTVARLPAALHDAAAAVGGPGRLLVLGGGQLASFATVTAFDTRSRTARPEGQLPTPLSDLAAVRVGGTIYTVGGYTGVAWSDRILAIRDGRARAVGRLPEGLRYAAVAAQGTDLIIAGGRTLQGPTADVVDFSTVTGRVRVIGRLPEPLMHASAAALDGRVYVVGGIGSGGAPVRSVVGIGPSGNGRVVARLPRPLSDAGVTAVPGRIVVVGGNDGRGPVSSLLWLRLAAPHP